MGMKLAPFSPSLVECLLTKKLLLNTHPTQCQVPVAIMKSVGVERIDMF